MRAGIQLRLEMFPCSSHTFHQASESGLASNICEKRFMLRQKRIVDNSEVDGTLHRVERCLALRYQC